MSTNMGIAIWCRTHEAVARNVYEGTSTSSPGPTSTAAKAMCSAAVPLPVVRQYLAPMNSRHSFSKAVTCGAVPPATIPLSSTALMNRRSSSVITGQF